MCVHLPYLGEVHLLSIHFTSLSVFRRVMLNIHGYQVADWNALALCGRYDISIVQLTWCELWIWLALITPFYNLLLFHLLCLLWHDPYITLPKMALVENHLRNVYSSKLFCPHHHFPTQKIIHFEMTAFTRRFIWMLAVNVFNKRKGCNEFGNCSTFV